MGRRDGPWRQTWRRSRWRRWPLGVGAWPGRPMPRSPADRRRPGRCGRVERWGAWGALLLGRCEARSHVHNLGLPRRPDDIPVYARNVLLDTQAKTDRTPSKCAAWAAETVLQPVYGSLAGASGRGTYRVAPSPPSPAHPCEHVFDDVAG